MKTLIFMLSLAVLLTGFVTTVIPDYPEEVPKNQVLSDDLPDGHYLVMQIEPAVQEFIHLDEIQSLEYSERNFTWGLIEAYLFDPPRLYCSVEGINKTKLLSPELAKTKKDVSKNLGYVSLHYDPGSSRVVDK
ncbi:hypothetical protein [Cyclobacterium marinum]|uniref:Uncharacterized protein n=1 Tax=Cyclobacterium marinum (strain ATCC 25205 / DSM 745 / LMG 13164 / NCIMB 1802) TaxID=880070 RepID=G0J387_CYCMS|nr:hypothetical protein [Cyclobacterium marinum]AEL24028.1 hypothetical protein Cycma_0246 [Cyclobacterium marinum DSM 745]